jgi:hypothetical protein
MTQHGGPEFSDDTNPGSSVAIELFFQDFDRPTKEEMDKAGQIIGAPHREIEKTQDSLSICEDLAYDIPGVTTVLAGMISVGHEALPPLWRRDPEEVRMVLSMVGHLEIGYIRAQQAAVRHGSGFPGLAEREAGIGRLLADLESGAGAR